MNSVLVKLKRDLKASPKKAAILGGLCLVAVYFWMPLLFGGSSSDAGKPPKVTASAAQEPTIPSQPTGGENKTVPPNWRKLVDWIARDPRMQSADLEGVRDPFALPERTAPAAAVATEEKPQPKQEAPEVTPHDAKLTLSSTLVGRARKVAIINGKSYSEGQKVAATTERQKVQFTVVEIQPRLVVLERKGKQYELKLRTVELVGAPDNIEEDAEEP